MFAMTSMGEKVDHRVNDGRGPNLAKVTSNITNMTSFRFIMHNRSSSLSC
jgi:hypothetical protein